MESGMWNIQWLLHNSDTQTRLGTLIFASDVMVLGLNVCDTALRIFAKRPFGTNCYSFGLYPIDREEVFVLSTRMPSIGTVSGC